MDKSKYSYLFSNVLRIDDLNALNNGLFIVVLHVDKIPPHIGLCIDQKFYSLKTNGKDFAVPIISIQKILMNKKISAAFISVHSSIDIVKVEQVYNEAGDFINDGSTCLEPLNNLFKPDREIQVITDLLIDLENKNMIGKTFTLNLPYDHNGIFKYTRDDIISRIETLKNYV